MDRIKYFIDSCLSRRSFHFFAWHGFALLVFYILAFPMFEFFAAFAAILMLPILFLYLLVLIIKEQRNPDFRIQNKFISHNPFYGCLVFLASLVSLFVYGLWLYMFLRITFAHLLRFIETLLGFRLTLLRSFLQ